MIRVVAVTSAALWGWPAARAEVRVEARSSSLTQVGSQGGVTNAWIINGVLLGGGANHADPGGTTEAGPIDPNAKTAFANTTQATAPLLATSSANASLPAGSVGIFVNAPGGAGGQTVVTARPTWTETVRFNNRNAAAVELGVFLDTDGSAVDNSGPMYGSLDVKSSIEMYIVNDANYKDVHLKGGPAFYMGGCQFIHSLQFGPRFEFQPSGDNMYGAWTTTPVNDFAGMIKTTRVIPPGVVSIGIRIFLEIDARSGEVVDYTEGVRFAFGTQPTGLTWTSESGVFLGSTAAGSADADGDGTPDHNDACPNDAA